MIGIGGVGSWTAEALARSGVGRISLVDLDEVCITNVNRQLHAIDGKIGRFKVEAVGERLRRINPGLELREVTAFLTRRNIDELLSLACDCIVDAIDEAEVKAHLIAWCRDQRQPLVVAGGAGGKRDPSAVRTDDIAFATNDRLLKRIRRTLRREYNYPPEPIRVPFGARAVYSTENARFPWSDGTIHDEPEPGSGLRLNCDSGFGTATPVTGAFGFAAAAEAIEVVTAEDESPDGNGETADRYRGA